MAFRPSEQCVCGHEAAVHLGLARECLKADCPTKCSAFVLDGATVPPQNIVDHPPHYSGIPAACSGCGKPIECIDIVQHLGFTLGNSVKYIWRADFKNAPIEDLKKSRWYLDHEIACREKAAKQ